MFDIFFTARKASIFEAGLVLEFLIIMAPARCWLSRCILALTVMIRKHQRGFYILVETLCTNIIGHLDLLALQGHVNKLFSLCTSLDGCTPRCEKGPVICRVGIGPT